MFLLSKILSFRTLLVPKTTDIFLFLEKYGELKMNRENLIEHDIAQRKHS